MAWNMTNKVSKFIIIQYTLYMYILHDIIIIIHVHVYMSVYTYMYIVLYMVSATIIIVTIHVHVSELDFCLDGQYTCIIILIQPNFHF